jgi:hypothetical protein
MSVRTCILCLLLAASTGLVAKGVYQEPAAFINEVFGDEPPAPGVLWITRALRDPVKEILGHSPGVLRLRYWGQGQRTAWILEEIGKEQPITVGLVVNANKLETLRVLEFRESRGWEVRHLFFTRQFNGAALTEDKQLDQPIDGISGATLSVRALKKLARLALYLHTQTPFANDTL